MQLQLKMEKSPMSKRTTLLITLFLFSLILSCANTSQRPTGGDGDKEAPKLAKTNPAHLATEIATDAKIVLEFNEWIDPASVLKGVQISPKVDSGFSVKVQGRKISIEPHAAWQDNRTYHVSTNSELVDFSENALEELSDLTFSTGSTLDSGIIKGSVNISPNLEKRVKVGLFLEEHITDEDSTLLTTFDYITQCDTLGNFSFHNIAHTDFRIIGFVDANANNKVNTNEAIYLSSTSSISTGDSTLFLTQAICDTTATDLEAVEVLSPTLLVLPIKTKGGILDDLLYGTITTKNDSTIVTDSLPFKLNSDSTLFVGNLEKPLDRNQYSLLIKVSKPFRDSTMLPFYQDTILFNGREDTDTTSPKISTITSEGVGTKYELVVQWKTPVLCGADTITVQDSSQNRFYFISEPTSGKKVSYRTNDSLPLGQRLTIAKESITATSYTSIPYAIDATDSTQFHFSTPSREKVSHSLSIITDTVLEKSLLQLEDKTNKSIYTIPFTSDTLVIETPVSGSYTVSVINDKNENGTYDTGRLFPFQSGEVIRYLSDTIKIPPRWEVEHSIQFNKTPKPDTPIQNEKSKVIMETK